MKSVKIEDEVHSLLKGYAELRGETISQVIEGAVDDMLPPTDLDKVLVQMHMRMDELVESISSLSFSKEPSAVDIDLRQRWDEAAETVRERERRKAIELEKAQKHAIDHPEDMPQ